MPPTLAEVNPRFNVARRLLGWYARHRRDLPWRPPRDHSHAPINPYTILVSEFMLQQTQVATVIPYFRRFMDRFPTLQALAAAKERQVLRLWQGLGYYRRARNLHAAAKKIAADFAGRVPHDPAILQTMPGIGRYTAGAVASLAYGARAPIVDGNVARVLCRLHLIRRDPRRPQTIRHLWQIAEQLLPRTRVGEFNSALMELGATLCTPGDPQCPLCPLRRYCRAAAAGLQRSIPTPRPSRPTPLVRRWTLCLSRRGRWLIEQRPPQGRWPGMWQFLTIPPLGPRPTPSQLRSRLGLRISPPRHIGQIRRALTHRRYVFDIFTADVDGTIPSVRPRRWLRLDQLHVYPLSRPQQQIAQLLAAL
ncbi:MAG: A/G-specific adenine glycosylase [Tepidisphaeraceae bacterium]